VSGTGSEEPKGQIGRLYDAHGEKVRYLLVGVVNTAISYVLFLVLLGVMGSTLGSYAETSTGLVALLARNYYLVAQWLGWVLMVPVSTTTMKYFAFRSGGKLRHQIPRAYVIYLPAQGLSSLLLWLTVRVIGMSPPAGQFITILVTTIFSYLGHKYFTFRVPLTPGEVDEDVAR